MPLLQLAKIQDVASQQVPRFAPTGFSSHSLPPLIILAQTGGNKAIKTTMSPVHLLTQNSKSTQAPADVAASLAIARARALALASMH